MECLETMASLIYPILYRIYSIVFGLYQRLLSTIYHSKNTGGRPEAFSEPPHQPRIPFELLELIAKFLFQLQPAPSNFVDGYESVCSVKPEWKDIAGFVSASPSLHQIGMMEWFQVIKIKHTEDWDVAVIYSCWVREMICSEGVLAAYHNKRVLTLFPKLYALSINSHRDISHNGEQFAYRKAFFVLPASLVKLEITHAHSPDAHVISAVKEYCPNLVELRLGRCTMFNRVPACEFWRAFPLEHNSYISDSGAEEYAASLARELAPLKHLRVLRMGLYLVPSSVVLAHRLYHARGLPAPAVIEWQLAIPLAEQPLNVHPENPIQVEPATTSALIELLHQPDNDFSSDRPTCNLCTIEFSEANQLAETVATYVLKESFPSLQTVEWMNWFSHRHLGVSSRST